VHFKGTGKKILFAIDFPLVPIRLKTAAWGGGGLFMNVRKRSKTPGKKTFLLVPCNKK
jgi:hypothetical protein